MRDRLEAQPTSNYEDDPKRVGRFLLKNGNRAIERMFRLNLDMAREELFEDFFKMRYEEVPSVIDQSRQIRHHVSQYVKTIEDLNTFIAQANATGTHRLHLAPLDAVDQEILDIAKSKFRLEYSKKKIRSAMLDGPPLCGLVVDIKEREKMEKFLDLELKSSIEEIVMNEKSLVEVQHRLIRLHLAPDTTKLDKIAEGEYRKQHRNQTFKVFVGFLAKIRTAIFGGLSILVPMLIMVLHPTLLTRLVTTCTFVIVVAITLTFLLENVESKDLVIATAAYAAVLVVLVGTGTDNDKSATQFTTTGIITGDSIAGSLVANTTAVKSESGLSNGVIGAIVVGSIVGVMVLLYIVWFLWARLASTYFVSVVPTPGIDYHGRRYAPRKGGEDA